MNFPLKALALLAFGTLAACSAPMPVIYSPTVQPTPQAAAPAPEAAPVQTSNGTAEYFRNTIGALVYFEVNQHTLTAQARGQLDRQAAWLQQHVGFAAVIEGHADEQGTREYNFALSARRANEVREYLVSRGVRASRLQIIPYGKERPVAVCSEESCYARNRRAVTQVRYAVGG